MTKASACNPGESSPRGKPDPFGPNTRWTIVCLAAGQVGASDEERDEAWRWLIERYQVPIGNVIRRRMMGHPRTEDAVDGFFGYLIEKEVLPKADRHKGRFREFVQGVVRRYVPNFIRSLRSSPSLEAMEAEILAPSETPEFEQEQLRGWGFGLLRLVLERLLEEKPRDGQLLIRYYGLPCPDTRDRAEQRSPQQLAREFGISEVAVNTANHRARKLFEKLLKEEVYETVSSAEDYEAEVESMLALLQESFGGAH